MWSKVFFSIEQRNAHWKLFGEWEETWNEGCWGRTAGKRIQSVSLCLDYDYVVVALTISIFDVNCDCAQIEAIFFFLFFLGTYVTRLHGAEQGDLLVTALPIVVEKVVQNDDKIIQQQRIVCLVPDSRAVPVVGL